MKNLIPDLKENPDELKKITAEDVRSIPGFESLSDAQVAGVISSISDLASICVNLWEKDQK